MPWFLSQLYIDTFTISPVKGLITLLAFGLVGFLMLWKTTHLNPVTVSAKLIVGFLIVRLSSSYWDFRHGFVEGAWPVLWTIFGILGAHYGYQIGRRTRRNDNSRS